MACATGNAVLTTSASRCAQRCCCRHGGARKRPLDTSGASGPERSSGTAGAAGQIGCRLLRGLRFDRCAGTIQDSGIRHRPRCWNGWARGVKVTCARAPEPRASGPTTWCTPCCMMSGSPGQVSSHACIRHASRTRGGHLPPCTAQDQTSSSDPRWPLAPWMYRLAGISTSTAGSSALPERPEGQG